MSEKNNIRVAEESTKAMNAHDNARIRTLLGEGYQFQAPGMLEPVDAAGRDVGMEGMWTAFPDLTFQTVQTIAQGDYVVLNWILTGTHDGPLATAPGETVPATGRKVTAPGSVTIEFKNGKIVREDVYYDLMGIGAQLGLVPEA